jgi:hypothetical protein
MWLGSQYLWLQGQVVLLRTKLLPPPWGGSL